MDDFLKWLLDDLPDWLMEDSLAWLLHKLFNQSKYWYLRLQLTNGKYEYFEFYHPAGSYIVYPTELSDYLRVTPSEKELIEDDFRELGYKIDITPRPPAIGGVP